jgi:hypothetical protein
MVAGHNLGQSSFLLTPLALLGDRLHSEPSAGRRRSFRIFIRPQGEVPREPRRDCEVTVPLCPYHSLSWRCDPKIDLKVDSS